MKRISAAIFVALLWEAANAQEVVLTDRAVRFANHFSIATNMAVLCECAIPESLTNGQERIEIGPYDLNEVVKTDDAVFQSFAFNVSNHLNGTLMNGCLFVHESPGSAMANALNEETLCTMTDTGLLRLFNVIVLEDGFLLKRFSVGKTNDPPEAVMLLRSNARLYLSSIGEFDPTADVVALGDLLFPEE